MKFKIMGILVFSLLFLLLSSCSNGGLTKTSGNFTYKINKDTNEIMLTGLSKEGQKKDVIVIPAMIDGRKIERIGHYVKSFDGGLWESNFKSDRLKIIYFPSGYSKSSLGYNFYRNLPKIEKIFWGDVEYAGTYCGKASTETFVSKQNYDANESYKNKYSYGDELIDYSYIKVANVSYYLNYGDNNCFFIDNVSDTKVNVVPPNPYREGYKFTGWYKDSLIKEKWDFEKDVVPKEELDSKGNVIYNEIKIYAGWEKK